MKPAVPTRQQPFLRLRFEDPDLETLFRRQFHERHWFQNRVAAVLGLLVYGFFAILDREVGGEHWQDIVCIRLCVTLPPLVLILVGLFSRQIAGRFTNLLVMLAVLIAGAGIVAMNTRLPPDAQNLYFTGLLIVVIFGLVFFRADFRWPAAATVVVFALYLGVAGLLFPVAFPHLLASIFFYVSAAATMIYTAWYLEHQERQAFLMEQRLRLLAHTDELTGLANRRAFFEHLESEWRRALRNGSLISLLLIDLDHLKQINDTRGHEAGDHALKHLAGVLESHARRPGDLAARVGGDEFALLLSGASRQNAMEIARVLSGDASNRREDAADRDSPVTATASVGLANTVPSSQDTSHTLLHMADMALYEAKRTGRARAVCADSMSGD